VQFELASGALSDLRVSAIAASGRMYTIPKSVQDEAEKALVWREENSRGGTPVGVSTAQILAAGGQIGLKKISHIAKYFPRHEVDKKSVGFSLSQDGFPSNGRTAWALWGGDAGQRWAQSIVTRENSKSISAAGCTVPGIGDNHPYNMATDYDADVDAFKTAHELSSEDAPEFVVRVRIDTGEIDRLYMVNSDGDAFVWDGSGWDDLGHVDSDIVTFDKALDDIYDTIEKVHVPIDAGMALVVSARFQQFPFGLIGIYDIYPEEAELARDAMSEIDWILVDASLTAAAEPEGAVAPGDGIFSPKERSIAAGKQVRDRGGKFARMGSRVSVGGDPNKTGNITKINKLSQSVTVKLDSGGSIDVQGTDTEAIGSTPQPGGQGIAPPFAEGAPLDTSGILGMPRAATSGPNATISGTLPPLGAQDMHDILYNYPAWVKGQREAGEKNTPTQTAPSIVSAEERQANYTKQLEKKTGVKLDERDLRLHPVYKDLFKKNPKYHLYYDPETFKVRASAFAVEVDEQKPRTVKELIEKEGVNDKGAGKRITPTTSDVQPMYLAIVSPDNPSAVFDLISIVPAQTNLTRPTVFKRVNAAWVQDDQILADLSSATPPPVVPLHGEEYIDVLAQVDGVANESDPNPVQAAGGLDRNRGKAEQLRRYWLYGRGALKIRWNTPGDWTRCYKHLAKYMGPRAKGYCALRHKEATGTWPGSRNNIGKKNRNLVSSGDCTLISEEALLEALYSKASATVAKNRIIASAEKTDSYGAKFSIPLVIPEDIESGDGRKFKKGAIEIRELPLPLLWQISTADGHSGSVVVGRIDSMERVEGGIGNAYGVFDRSEHGKEVERMVREGFISGVSADLDNFEASEDIVEKASDEAADSPKDKKIGGDKMTITKARVMAVTVVPKPAFQECKIYLDTADSTLLEENMEQMPDGIYVEENIDQIDAASIVACGLLAGAIPAVPPAEWFSDPKLAGPTPLAVDDLGRVFGHIASWQTDHIGMSRGTRAPKSRTGYAYFHTGVVRADDGKDYTVGQLTLAGGHASLEASAVDAARHYDDTGSAIADVHAGEDMYGIWVAGALRSNATMEQIRALRASAPSGDWRPINGALELVAVCQVNVPGFPIARARVASGQVYALVAAGAAVLARMKADPINELSTRIAELERKEKLELSAAADAVSARLRSNIEYGSFGYISKAARTRLAEEGKALPDGSFPIRDSADLERAISAYGRATPGKRAMVRRHIMKHARKLKRVSVIPEHWKTASLIDDDVVDSIRARVASLPVPEPVVVNSLDDLRARVASAKEGLLAALPIEDSEVIDEDAAPEAVSKVNGKYVSGITQPRDSRGKFRDVLARLKSDLGAAGLQNVMDKAEEANVLLNAGNYDQASSSSAQLLELISRLDSGALDATALGNVRESARLLGQVISNLPLPFGNQNQKVRFSDLPPVLQNLIDDMIDKVEAKIGKEDADEATASLKSYKSGSDVYSQGEVSSELSTLLRLLT